MALNKPRGLDKFCLPVPSQYTAKDISTYLLKPHQFLNAPCFGKVINLNSSENAICVQTQQQRTARAVAPLSQYCGLQSLQPRLFC